MNRILTSVLFLSLSLSACSQGTQDGAGQAFDNAGSAIGSISGSVWLNPEDEKQKKKDADN